MVPSDLGIIERSYNDFVAQGYIIGGDMEITSGYPIPAIDLPKANTYLFDCTYKRLSNKIIALEPQYEWGDYARCSEWDDHYINGFIILNVETI